MRYYAGLLPSRDRCDPQETRNTERLESSASSGGPPSQPALSPDTREKDLVSTDPNLSKPSSKASSRMHVSQLKYESNRPETVELWDTTASDPITLIYLKAYRNSVPVPVHWSQKRKYLQGKRGIEKPPFQLPSFIEATGISTLRNAHHDKEETKKVKQKGRQRIRPKMNRLDINYEILRDAFMKYQCKPHLTNWGEVYYEGKEYELSGQNWRPGFLSDRLREALGIGIDLSIPPPWLINMQRYGPPPSYPGLKISGLNAPIPHGCRFGYGPGEWGKPPVDQEGRALYGNVFGSQDLEEDVSAFEATIDKAFEWGKIEELESESICEEEAERIPDRTEDYGKGTEGLSSTYTGVTSVTPQYLKSYDCFSLRKEGTSTETPHCSETLNRLSLYKDETSAESPMKQASSKRLYQVLRQWQTNAGTGIVGTDHGYSMPENQKKDLGKERQLGALTGERSKTDLHVSLTMEEMEGLDENALHDLYERRFAGEKIYK